MHEDMQRIHDGRELLGVALKRTAKDAELMLAALKGFRRDLSLSAQATTAFSADFSGDTHGLAVPPHDSGEGFGDLWRFLRLCFDALDGDIRLKTPDAADKERLLEEAGISRRNLAMLADAAQNLYKSLKTALLDIESFNTKNIEVGFPGANIFFDREGLALAMETARAIGERAVRHDIEIAEGMERVRTGMRSPEV